MNTKKENDILEATLSIAENGYAEAYRFLAGAYENDAESLGPQALYFLACLAGGAGMPQKALAWIRKAVADNGWWYRPEVLEDDDLELLKDNAEFIALKAVSDGRYADAAAKTKEVFSWERKKADKLFLAVHGNTQNGQTARNDWETLLGGNSQWQIETIQSAEPDGYGTYRWSYDMVSYQSVARALKRIQSEGYGQIVCGIGRHGGAVITADLQATIWHQRITCGFFYRYHFIQQRVQSHLCRILHTRGHQRQKQQCKQ